MPPISHGDWTVIPPYAAAAIAQVVESWKYEEFRQELLDQMEPKFGRHHGGPERQETASSRAERMLAEELKRRGWAPDQLAERRKRRSGEGENRATIAKGNDHDSRNNNIAAGSKKDLKSYS